MLLRAIALLALGVMGQSLFRVLLFLVDRLLLGHFSSDALASMQISQAFVFTLVMVLGSFTAKLAVTSGLRTGLVLSIIIGSIAALLSVMHIDALFALFPHASPGVLDAARQYLYWGLGALPLYLCVMTAAPVIQRFDGGRLLFSSSCIAICIHFICDLVLIFGGFGLPALGAMGAAIASVIGAACQCALLLTALCRRLQFLEPNTGRPKVLAASLAAFVQRGMQYGGYFAFMVVVALLGDAAMGAHQVLIAIGALCFLLVDGFGTAVQGYTRGAKQALFLAVAALLVPAILFVWIPKFFIELFITDPAVVALGVQGLQVMGAVLPLMAISVVLSDTLRAFGEAKAVAIISFFGGVIVRLCMAYILAFHLQLGFVGIWWAIGADWLVRVLFIIPFVCRHFSGEQLCQEAGGGVDGVPGFQGPVHLDKKRCLHRQTGGQSGSESQASGYLPDP